MPRESSPSRSAITLLELEDIITKSSGASHAREFAPSLLKKIRTLEARGTYGGEDTIRALKHAKGARSRIVASLAIA
jgi:hypothetical protein